MEPDTNNRENHPLIDWSWLRWRWSALEILMIVGVLVTLGAVGAMLWGTIQDFRERGPAIGGSPTAGTGGGSGQTSSGGE